jgi:hypothetical protein
LSEWVVIFVVAVMVVFPVIAEDLCANIPEIGRMNLTPNMSGNMTMNTTIVFKETNVTPTPTPTPTSTPTPTETMVIGFETNLSELGKVPIIIFENKTFWINGTYNQTEFINLTGRGYINVFKKLEGYDLYIKLMIYNSILLTGLMFLYW